MVGLAHRVTTAHPPTSEAHAREEHVMNFSTDQLLIDVVIIAILLALRWLGRMIATVTEALKNLVDIIGKLTARGEEPKRHKQKTRK